MWWSLCKTTNRRIEARTGTYFHACTENGHVGLILWASVDCVNIAVNSFHIHLISCTIGIIFLKGAKFSKKTSIEGFVMEWLFKISEKIFDKTPYTIMFGPDKCGNDNKVNALHICGLDFNQYVKW